MEEEEDSSGPDSHRHDADGTDTDDTYTDGSERSDTFADDVDRALAEMRAGEERAFQRFAKPASRRDERALGDPRPGTDLGLTDRHECSSTQDPAAMLPGLLTGHVASEASLPEGTRIGRYSLIREIGRGGLGVVYEAAQDEPRRAVAIKLVRAGRLAGTDEIALLRREGRVLARLRHPSIVNILEAGTSEEGQAYVAMDLAPGVPLDRWSEAEPRSIASSVSVVIAVCDAIESAHRRGVIHGDLKPGNIVVDPEGVPRVLDFGLARLERGMSEELSVDTLVGAFVGTIPWMSPEQANGDEVDVRTDVHALGLILYRLIAGRHAYEVPRNPIAAATAIAETRPRVIDDPKVSPDLRAIANKALQKERALRYSSVTALADDLRSYLRGDPVSARPPTVIQNLRLLVRNHRTVFAAAVLVIVVSWSATAVTMTSLADARQSADESAKVLEYLTTTLRLSDPQVGGLAEPRVEDLLDAAALKIGDLAIYPSMEAEIRSILGVAFTRLHRFRKARPHLEEALRIRRDLHAVDHEDLATSLRDLGFLDHSDRRFDEAMAHKSAALDMRKRLFGDGAHPDVVQSREEMGDLIRDRYPSRHRDVAQLYKRNVDLLLAEPGRWSEKVWAQSIYARQLIHQGDSMAGHDMAVEAIENVGQADGRSHGNAVMALTWALCTQGRNGAAVQVLRRALETEGSAFDAVSRAKLLGELALVASADWGSNAETLAMAREAHQICIDQLGPGHQRALDAGERLVRVYLDLGDVAAAKECVKELVRHCENDHGRQSGPMVNLLILDALTHVAAGERAEMETLLAEALAQTVRDSHFVAQSQVYEYLGTCREAVGDLEGAQQVAQIHLSHCRNHFGEESKQTLMALSLIARYERALRSTPGTEHAIDTQIRLARRLGVDRGTTFAGTLVIRGRVAFENGEAADGEAFFQEALEMIEASVSRSHFTYKSAAGELDAWRSGVVPDTTKVAWCADSPRR